MPGIGPEENEARRTVKNEVPPQKTMVQGKRTNDFQRETKREARKTTTPKDAFFVDDTRDTLMAIRESKRVKKVEKIVQSASRFQAERMLLERSVVDQELPPSQSSEAVGGTSKNIHSFIQSSTYTPPSVSVRDKSDTTLGRPRNNTANRTSEMLVRELPGTVFA